jgi:hypothetical protein
MIINYCSRTKMTEGLTGGPAGKSAHGRFPSPNPGGSRILLKRINNRVYLKPPIMGSFHS